MAEHYYSEKQTSKPVYTKIKAMFFEKEFDIYTGSGIFSVGKVDKGTELLLNSCIIPEKAKVLDLGCGYGIVGIAVALGHPSSEVILRDINKRAIALAKKNIRLNRLENAEASQGYCFEGLQRKFDVVLLNPPQSAGKEICFEMIQGSYDHLDEDGSLQLVARHNKGGKMLSEKMQDIFGNVSILSRKSGYRVYMGEKKKSDSNA